MMKPYRKILVAVDGSHQALCAVRYVSSLFPPDQTAVHLFNVHTGIPESFQDLRRTTAVSAHVSAVSAWDIQARKDMKSFLQISRNLLVNAGFREEGITTTLQDKKVGIARDILAESRNGYDALIVGRTGTSRFKDFIIGSIADKLIGKTPHIPLVVVSESPAPQNIMVGFDGSDSIVKGLSTLAALLAAENCEVLLCHVVRRLNRHREKHTPFAPEAESEWLDVNTKELLPKFNAAKKKLLAAGVDPSRLFIEVFDEPFSRAARIVREAETREYGTIVVGRRGLSMVEEFFLGRVSTKVLHMANQCTVWLL